MEALDAGEWISEGEFEYVKFEWRGRKVRCERLLMIDFDESFEKEDIFADSGISDEIEKKLEGFDDDVEGGSSSTDWRRSPLPSSWKSQGR